MQPFRTVWGDVPQEKPMDVEALARELNDAAIRENAGLSGATVYGAQAWDQLRPTAQRLYLAVARRALELLTKEPR